MAAPPALHAPTADPSGYSQQLASNPVGTFLFGPAMPAHRPEQDLQIRAGRRRHFLLWIGAFAALLAMCTLIPAFIGLARLGALGFGIGLVAGLIFCLIPASIYALGLGVYAAGLFEWGILFNSRRGRKIRAGLGDDVLRKLYLGAGLAMFVVGLLGGLGATAFTSFSVLLADVPDAPAPNALAANVPAPIAPPPQAGVPQPAAPAPAPSDNPIGVLESDLQNTRMQLDEQARSLGPLLAQAQSLQTSLAANPNQAELLQFLSQCDRNIAAQGAAYEPLLRQWENQRNELQQLVEQSGRTSQILAANATLPPEVKLDVGAIQAAIGRSKNAFHEPQLQSWEDELKGFVERTNQRLTLQEQLPMPLAGQEALLTSLNGELLITKSIAENIAAVEKRHNYKSTALAKYRQLERRIEALKVEVKAELDRRKGPR